MSGSSLWEGLTWGAYYLAKATIVSALTTLYAALVLGVLAAWGIGGMYVFGFEEAIPEIADALPAVVGTVAYVCGAVAFLCSLWNEGQS